MHLVRVSRQFWDTGIVITFFFLQVRKVRYIGEVRCHRADGRMVGYCLVFV